MNAEEEIASLKKEVRALKQIILEMKDVIKLLTDKDDRAKAFVEKIEALAGTLVDEKQDEIQELVDNQ